MNHYTHYCDLQRRVVSEPVEDCFICTAIMRRDNDIASLRAQLQEAQETALGNEEEATGLRQRLEIVSEDRDHWLEKYEIAIEDSARAENAWKNAEAELRKNGIDGNGIVDALIFGFNMVYTSPAWGDDERSPEGWKQKEAALRREFSATVKKAITLFMVFLEFAKERLRVKDDCLQVKVKEVAILRTALAAEQERARVAEEALTALKVHVGIPHDTPDDEVADRLLGIAQPYTDIDVDALIFAFNMVYTSPTWGGDERSPEGWKQKEAALRKAFTSTLRAEKDRLISEVNTAHSDIAGHEEEVSRPTAEREERKKKHRGADAEVEFLRTEMHRHEDLCVDLRSELRTLRRTSVRVDVLLRWMFSAEPWNSPAVNWSILNRILIARSRRSTTNTKGE